MQFNVLEDKEQSETTIYLQVTPWEDSVCVGVCVFFRDEGCVMYHTICLGFGKNVFCRRANSIQLNATRSWQ